MNHVTDSVAYLVELRFFYKTSNKKILFIAMSRQ